MPTDHDWGLRLEAGRVPVIRSRRLVLRPLRRDDAEAIRRLADDVAVARWMSRIPHPYTLADALFFIDRIAPHEIAWAIDAAGEGLVGVGGLTIPPEGREVELGYWLGQAFWGRGFATEAAAGMLAHAWASGALRVRSGCFDGNVRSRHVLEKLGFRVIGRSTRHCLAQGVDLPHFDMMADRPAGPASSDP